MRLILACALVFSHTSSALNPKLVFHQEKWEDPWLLWYPDKGCTRSLKMDPDSKDWARCYSPRFVRMTIEGAGYVEIDRDSGEIKRCQGSILEEKCKL